MKGPFGAPVADVLIGDAFLTKLNPQGTALVFSTFLGGAGDDAGTAVRLDALGNIYVAGFTDSNDFPTTSDALQRTFGGGGQQNQNQDYGDGFVALFDATGAKLTYSTFFGGAADDEVMAMVIDSAGNAILGGLDGLAKSDYEERLPTGLWRLQFPRPRARRRIFTKISGFRQRLPSLMGPPSPGSPMRELPVPARCPRV